MIYCSTVALFIRSAKSATTKEMNTFVFKNAFLNTEET